MATHISDSTHVYLYDSVTGTPFGPQFESESDASDFLDWLDDNDGRDPRIIPADELLALHIKWEDVC